MPSHFYMNCEQPLSCDDKAYAVNLAFSLELQNYEKDLLHFVSKSINPLKRKALFEFWLQTSTVTQKAYFCVREYEGGL